MSLIIDLRDKAKSLLEAHTFFTGQPFVLETREIEQEIKKAVSKFGFLTTILNPRIGPVDTVDSEFDATVTLVNGNLWRYRIGIAFAHNPLKKNVKTAYEAAELSLNIFNGSWNGVGQDNVRGGNRINRFFVDSLDPVEDPDGLIVYQLVTFTDVIVTT